MTTQILLLIVVTHYLEKVLILRIKDGGTARRRKSFFSLDHDLYDFCCKWCLRYQSWLKHC